MMLNRDGLLVHPYQQTLPHVRFQPLPDALKPDDVQRCQPGQMPVRP
ncbi:MAG: hypothetical protein QOE61_5472, partial [Micromonosporaceae bacterium]|nr:hypothetical protein [Micromonosporaceae bacterium]